MIELLGFIASIFVLAAMSMKEMKNLRKLNLIACTLWILYGVLIVSLSVTFVNTAILAINIFYLVKNRRNVNV